MRPSTSSSEVVDEHAQNIESVQGRKKARKKSRSVKLSVGKDVARERGDSSLVLQDHVSAGGNINSESNLH
jgi:hypothetical protein